MWWKTILIKKGVEALIAILEKGLKYLKKKVEKNG